MLARLFNQTRLFIRAWRGCVAGVPVPRLLWSWLRLLFHRGGVDVLCLVRIGDLSLYAANADEARFLVEEIFLMATYGPALPKSSPRILDCGANCGFATAFFKLLHPDAQITAFEPSPSSCALLRRNVADNHFKGVEIVEAACGGKEGTLDFVISERLSLISSADPARGTGQRVSVSVVPLSRWVGERVDLLKLDVEGAEHEVLAELIESRAICRIDRLAIEYHHRMGTATCRMGGFLKLLEQEGFTYSLLGGEAPGVRFGTAFQDVMIYASRISQ